MKKIILIISTLILSFIIVSCDTQKVDSMEILETLYELVEIEINPTNTYETITKNITLKTEYEGFEDVEVIWVSNGETIVINGNLGVVTRPLSDTLVRLSATLKLNDKQITKHFSLVVLKEEEIIPDTTKPIIKGYKDYNLTVGDSEPNWLEGITVEDNVDETLDVTIIYNNVNMELPGTYQIIYSATDLSGNEATVTITVIVKPLGEYREGVTYIEDFETNTAPTTTRYGGGSFVSQGITWEFDQAINAGIAETGKYKINDNGILLRRASDSFLKANFTGGLQSFSFDWRKAFTGGSFREVEVLLTDLSTNQTFTYEDSMTGAGEDQTIFKFLQKDLKILGDWSITIKIKGTSTVNAHITIDNFSWTTNPGELIPQNELDATSDKDQLTLTNHIIAPTNLDLVSKGNKNSDITWSYKDTNNTNNNLINLVTGDTTLPLTDQVHIILVATITNGDYTTTKEFDILVGEDNVDIKSVRNTSNNSYVYTKGIITSFYETTTEIKFFIEDNNSGIYVVAPLSYKSNVLVGNEITIKGTKNTVNNQVEINDIRSINLLTQTTITPLNIDSDELNLNPSKYVQLFGLIHESYDNNSLSYILETDKGPFEVVIPNDLKAEIKLSIQNKLSNLTPGLGITIKAPVYQNQNNYYLLITNTEDITLDDEIDLNTVTSIILNNIELPIFNSPITNKLVLLDSNKLLFDATIIWSSSNTNVLLNDGTIIRQDDDTPVNFTYEIKYNKEVIKTDTYQLIIKSKIPLFEGYYQSLTGLEGQYLVDELYSILNNTGQYQTTTYGDARDLLEKTDAWIDYNTDYVYLIYTDTLKGSVSNGYPDEGPALAKWDGGATWNREHVWAKSLFGTGNYDPSNSTRGIDADLHNLRAADTTVNSTRSNNIFINQVYNAGGFGNYGSQWYPGDNHRGDVARILFYMDIRWGALTDLSKIGDLNTLLQWHELDPVDAFEINRNNIIFSHQNNRNPFIDHPELANMIYVN
ncbi:endonuclease [Acholeplasma granularum]|uniref:endonuclease n=1 Tax=Acholeplasma granularum TaxID=264635 RepID=UPI00046F0F87|nr:endonuclease [Acholeplasma granularum]